MNQVIFIIVGTLLVNCLGFIPSEFINDLFLGSREHLYPLTFQNVMWIIFFYGIGISYNKNQDIKSSECYLDGHLLPERFESIIDQNFLNQIIKKNMNSKNGEMGYLPEIIFQITLQYQTNRSVDACINILTQQTDLIAHQIELKYAKLKYLTWLIPTIGFMGTVYGISLTVFQVSSFEPTNPKLLSIMAGSLAVAFNTTLLALIQSAILVFIQQTLETKEEYLLNQSFKYVLNNFINRVQDEGFSYDANEFVEDEVA